MKRFLLIFLLCGNCWAAAIGQWKMNDDAANYVVLDSVGSNNGVYTRITPQNTSTGATTGQINGALELDGVLEYIGIADQDIFTPDGSAFSITAWISLSADEGALNFTIANKMGTAIEWSFAVSGDQLNFTLYDESAAQASMGRLDTTTDYSTYEGSGFIFVAGTYDGGSSSTGVKLYLHDRQVDDADNNNKTFVNVDNSSEDVYIGRYSTSYAKGEIDNVVFYNQVLTLGEIQSLYNNGVGTEEVALGKKRRARYSDGYRTKYRSRYN